MTELSDGLLLGQPLTALRGAYSGAVFIVASGPSTRDFPLSRYASYPMLAMNGSICCFAPAGITPFFYLCDDSSFVRNRLPLLLQAIEQAQHLALSCEVVDSLLERAPQALDGRKMYRFERINRPPAGGELMNDRQFARQARRDTELECRFSWLRQKPNRIGFSRNLDKGYFGSRTIPYAGIQLAYHLGFSRVFVVGMDLDSSLGRFYEQGGAAVKSRLDGDYQDYILPSFELLADRVLTPEFRVYNLSLQSRLPGTVLPKLSLAQLDELLAVS
ncbi:MAG TPA: lipopolysaccharide core biosynthesis protein [Pseudomonas sp.]|nr:lipopolysaccharide core biosynthesis protein [Pseudomonas sp.]